MRPHSPARGGSLRLLAAVLFGVFAVATVLAVAPEPAAAAAKKKGKGKGKGDKGDPASADPDAPEIAFPTGPAGKKGGVEILCFVPGAEVWVEDKLVGKTPLEKPVPLPAGKYTVKVTKPGFSDYIDVILVPPGDPTLIEVSLIATSGYVFVTSTVADTQVTIDGTFVGTAPYEGELLVGTHELRVTKLCYKDYIETISTVAGTEYRFDVKMEELPPALNPCVKKDTIAYTPFYKKTWFLVVLGAAVVGAGTATGILLFNPCLSGKPFGCSSSPETYFGMQYF